MQPTAEIDTLVGFRTRLHEMSALLCTPAGYTGGGRKRCRSRTGSFDARSRFSQTITGAIRSVALREMQRVAERVAVFQWDDAELTRYWLIRDYLPEVA